MKLRSNGGACIPIRGEGKRRRKGREGGKDSLILGARDGDQSAASNASFLLCFYHCLYRQKTSYGGKKEKGKRGRGERVGKDLPEACSGFPRTASPPPTILITAVGGRPGGERGGGGEKGGRGSQKINVE